MSQAHCSIRRSAAAVAATLVFSAQIAAAQNGTPGPAAPAALVLHVDLRGDDTHAGTATAPFKTLSGARDAIRRLKKAGPVGAITVEIAPGTYPQEASLTLTAEDSGTPTAPVIYRAQSPGTVMITGCREIPITDLAPVTDASAIARLDPAAVPHVRTLKLNGSGLRFTGPFPDRFSDRGGIFELFDSLGRLPVSRWPNDGEAKMSRVLVNGDKSVPGAFVYTGDRPSRWLANKSVWLKGKWRVGWEDPAIKVGSIDPATSTITFAVGLHAGIGSKYHRPAGNGEEPWHAINLMEEIDQPGEWAIDFDSQTLYVWPRDTTASATLLVTQNELPLIDARGVKHVQWIGLTLQHSLGDGMVLEEVDSCVVAGTTVRNIAGRGVVLHGMRSSVQSCDIHDIGRGAIYVSGGDRKALTRSENLIVNNHLHHYGQLQRQYSAGVHVGALGNPNDSAVRDAVGIRVAHNAIHHGPRDGILYSGNDNLYEFNEIYYCGFDTADVGAFYSWLDWTMRGNVIRYNYIHDTVGGVNPDDGAAGNTVYGNVFAGKRVGVWIASGPDNVIRHNLFIKPEGSVFGIDDRGVGRGYATNKRLIDRVRQLEPDKEPWASAHPEMATMLDKQPELPWRTQFVGNLIVSKNPAPTANKMSAKNRQRTDLLTERDNVTVTEDPGFVDLAKRDYTLRPDAAVLKSIPGFEPIPFGEIGLKIAPDRLTLPTDAQMQRGPEHDPFGDNASDHFGT